MADKDVIDSEKFGKAIAGQRKRMGLTQDKLSRLAGISRSYMADVESGRYTPSLITSFKIARVLDRKLDSLLIEAEIPYKREAD